MHLVQRLIVKRVWPKIAKAILKCVQEWWTSIKMGNPASAIATMEIRPGAPGMGEGVDNNCDGVISDEEAVACPLDLDGDLAVTVSDVLTLLSEFGCAQDCSNDVSGDGQVSVADVLALLGGYGMTC